MGIANELRKGVQMSEKKQGAAEWLRGIVGEYEAEQSPASCSLMAKLLGIECGDTTCRECTAEMMTAVADRIDAERALPEGVEWPRFEDGELVKVGDEVEWDGDVMRVGAVWFHREGWGLNVSCPGVDGTLHGEYGERVKRPTPKVLDADGVPIEVGDTVWATYDGRKYVVKAVCSDGSLSPEMVTDDGCMVKYEEGGWDFAKKVTHERPDSWERLSNDAKMGAVTYADRILGVDTREMTTEEDYEAFARDIVRRAKALAKAGE